MLKCWPSLVRSPPKRIFQSMMKSVWEKLLPDGKDCRTNAHQEAAGALAGKLKPAVPLFNQAENDVSDADVCPRIVINQVCRRSDDHCSCMDQLRSCMLRQCTGKTSKDTHNNSRGMCSRCGFSHKCSGWHCTSVCGHGEADVGLKRRFTLESPLIQGEKYRPIFLQRDQCLAGNVYDNLQQGPRSPVSQLGKSPATRSPAKNHQSAALQPIFSGHASQNN